MAQGSGNCVGSVVATPTNENRSAIGHHQTRLIILQVKTRQEKVQRRNGLAGIDAAAPACCQGEQGQQPPVVVPFPSHITKNTHYSEEHQVKK